MVKPFRAIDLSRPVRFAGRDIDLLQPVTFRGRTLTVDTMTTRGLCIGVGIGAGLAIFNALFVWAVVVLVLVAT